MRSDTYCHTDTRRSHAQERTRVQRCRTRFIIRVTLGAISRTIATDTVPSLSLVRLCPRESIASVDIEDNGRISFRDLLETR